MGWTNLPSSLTSFVGRDPERADLRSLLRGSRLVTLTGSGGVGKTRLALESAHDLIDAFLDGVWFVDLTLVSDGELIPHVAAEALGFRELPFQDRRDQLLSELSDSLCLIVLDNCEHMIEASAIFVDELLRACPRVAILATSREPLGVSGETTFQVLPLSLPPEGPNVTVDDVSEFEAIQLFVDRAQLGDPHLVLNDRTVPTIVGICRRLDGVPLALELAAARVRSFNIDEIATGLDERFQLLTGGPRTAASRQQTLLASVKWSHELLTPEQKAVFRRLGAFVGYFSASAAHAVCDNDENVGEAFLGLVERSLVQIDRNRQYAPYRLLETIRQFALTRLEEAGEEHATSARHLDHYAQLAIAAGPELQGSNLTESVARLASEHDNLKSALDWATEHHSDTALRMTAALATYWFTHGHWTEAKQRATAALEALDAPAALRGRALAEVARIAATAVDGPTAIMFGETALEIGRSLDDKTIIAPALWALSTIYAFLDPRRARPLIAESMEAARSAGLEHLLLRGKTTLGIIEAQAGELRAARTMLREAGEEALATGLSLALIPNRMWLSWTCVVQGELEEAARLAEEGLDICRRLGNPQFESYITSNLVFVAAYRGEHARSRSLAETALTTAERLSDPVGLIAALSARAVAAYCEGDLVSAEHSFNDVVPLARAAGPAWVQSFALLGLSEVCRCAGDIDTAMSSATRGGEVARIVSNRWLDARARVVQAMGLVATGETDAAERLVHDALPTLVELDARVDLVAALNALAGVAAASSAWEEVARLLGAASELAGAIELVQPVLVKQQSDEWGESATAALGAAAVEGIRAKALEAGVEGVIEHASRGWGRRARPRSGWESLTPTELKIVGLVAEGLTNPQIGDRMFISRRTVQTHLTHVFGKLGISSRSELAAEATRRGAAT